MRKTTYIVLYFTILSLTVLIITACQEEPAEEETDILLATVHNKSLYLSELDGMLPVNTSYQDTLNVVNAYIERWIRKTLLMHEAERNLPKDLDIDELVRDYRASLILHTYEQQLVENELDSLISKSELNDFYERNKEQYQLEAPIIRCNFIKVPLDANQLATIRTLWQENKPENQVKLLALCNNSASEYLLADSLWYSVEEIAEELPKGSLDANNVGSRKEFTIQDNDFLYLFRLLEVVNRKEIAPLSYIENQATKVILHRRKIKLLEEKKEELYDLEADQVKVYSFQIPSKNNYEFKN